MKEELSFDIVKLFKLLLVIIFIKELRAGFFRGFLKSVKDVLVEYKGILVFYLIFILGLMFFVDKPVVEFWQTKAFQMKKFYYPGVLGNLLGNGDYIYSFMIVVILVSKIFKNETLAKKYSLAMTASIVAGILNSFIKIVFRRDRPDIYEPRPFKYTGYNFSFSENIKHMRGDYSLPSGHTTVSAVGFITLALLTKNKFLKVVYLIIPIITAYGRTYFSKHWVSDTAISILIGIIFANVVLKLYNSSKRGTNEII